MAVHRSVIKRARQSEKARLRNRMWKSRIKSAKINLEKAIVNNEIDSLDNLYRKYVSLVDKAASKRIIHRNNASRKKTRIAQRIGQMSNSKQIANKK